MARELYNPFKNPVNKTISFLKDGETTIKKEYQQTIKKGKTKNENSN